MRPRQRPPVNQKETGNGRYPFVKLQKSGGRKMPDSFQLEMIVAAEPQRVFSAWMDSREHAAFTGGGEAVVESWAGGRFIAWDGYIHGILLGVDEGRRIVQTWRTSELPPQATSGNKGPARKTVPRKSAAKSAARKAHKQRKQARRPAAARRKTGGRRSRR